MRQTGLDFNYLKSLPGVLKILEIVRDGNIFNTTGQVISFDFITGRMFEALLLIYS